MPLATSSQPKLLPLAISIPLQAAKPWSRWTAALEGLKSAENYAPCIHSVDEGPVWKEWVTPAVLEIRHAMVEEMTATAAESSDEDGVGRMLKERTAKLEQLRSSLQDAQRRVAAQGMYSDMQTTTTTHRGVSANFSRMNRPMPILVSYALLILTTWLPSITTDLPTLSLFGCGVVFLTQLIIRTRGLRYFPVSKLADH